MKTMADPTPNAPAIQWITAASTFALALIGLDHFSIIWSLVGSLGAQSRVESKGRLRAVAALLMNTLLGALAGSALAAAFWPDTAQVKYALCALSPVVLSKYLFRFADALGDAVENSLPAAVSRVLGAGAAAKPPADKEDKT
jgi:hypothetical protein